VNDANSNVEHISYLRCDVNINTVTAHPLPQKSHRCTVDYKDILKMERALARLSNANSPRVASSTRGWRGRRGCPRAAGASPEGGRGSGLLGLLGLHTASSGRPGHAAQIRVKD
jgi:hypothetical protein